MEKLKVVITLVERVRSRDRDRGLERFDEDYEIAQREEKRKFFLFFFDKWRREIGLYGFVWF